MEGVAIRGGGCPDITTLYARARPLHALTPRPCMSVGAAFMTDITTLHARPSRLHALTSPACTPVRAVFVPWHRDLACPDEPLSCPDRTSLYARTSRLDAPTSRPCTPHQGRRHASCRDSACQTQLPSTTEGESSLSSPRSLAWAWKVPTSGDEGRASRHARYRVRPIHVARTPQTSAVHGPDPRFVSW
jgi:hypothetical protein